MTERLHLLPRHRRMLGALLRKHLPDVEVWAYGSRVNGRSHDGSDLDLVLRGPGLKQLPGDSLADFEEAVRESNIPFLVEAHDWVRLPERFHHEIRREHVVLTEAVFEDTSKKTEGAEKWPTVRLGEVVDLLTGFPFKSDSYVNDPNAPRLLRGDNIAQGTLRWDGAKRWPIDEGANMAQFWLREGDVVLAMDRPWIEAGLKFSSIRRMDLPALLVQRVARLRGSKRLDTRFLKYVIGCRDFVDHVLSVQTGTAIPHISAQQIREFKFPLPPLTEQNAIAHVLGTLDDKIELNRRMNGTLETMVRALFTSWFVNFDPVRAKMEGRNSGLPQHLVDLFPDSLVDSNVDEIPEGWKYGTLNEVAFVNPESWSAKYPPEKVVYVDLANTKWGYIESVQTFPWAEAPSRARRVLRKGDTIIGTVRPGNGSFALVDEDGLTGSTGFAVLRPREELDRGFVWCAATSLQNIDRLSHLADGGAYPAVRPDAVGETPVVLAGPATRAAFSRLADPLLDKIDGNKRRSRDLTGLRDTLLPRLISGEVRLRDVEQVAEAIS